MVRTIDATVRLTSPNNKNYSFEHVYVFHDGNVDTPEAFEGVTYLPIYMMGMALG